MARTRQFRRMTTRKPPQMPLSTHATVVQCPSAQETSSAEEASSTPEPTQPTAETIQPKRETTQPTPESTQCTPETIQPEPEPSQPTQSNRYRPHHFILHVILSFFLFVFNGIHANEHSNCDE